MFKKQIVVVKKYFALGANSKKWLFHLFFSAILRSGSKLLIPLAAAAIVEYATDGDFEKAMICALVFLGTAVFHVLCHRYNYWAYLKNSTYVLNKLQQLLLDKIATYDENFSKDIPTAQIVGTANKDITEAHFVPDRFFDAITETLGIFIAMGALLFIDVFAGLIAIATTLVAFLIFNHNMEKYTDELARQREAQDDIVGLMEQSLNGNKEIKSFGVEAEVEKYLDAYKKRWRKVYFRKRYYNDHAWVFSQLTLGFGKILVYLLMIYLVLSEHHNVAVLVLAIGYYENAESAFWKLQNGLEDIYDQYTRINRIYRLFNYKTKNMLEFGDDGTDDIAGKVEFRKVSFTYEKQETMKNVSFLIKPRSLTAIVGKSGSGKSTIFRLLLRLYRASSGEILLDNKDIYDYSTEVYASNVAIVTQKPFVFDMTIRENLSLVDADFEHQVAACKKAGIHDFIMSLPEAYETRLAHDGENISIGQKQLIALARTLLSRAEVLLFDEVTSSLDLNTSKKIMGILEDLKKDHTILMITHKPQLMKIADEIMVIDKGKLVGKGKHKELIFNNKYYQALQK